LIELLLVGPLSTRQIIHGQWRGLLKMFAAPVVLIVILQAAAMLLMEGPSWESTSFSQQWAEAWVIAGFSSMLSAVAVVANMAALTWFGMWMGLTSKSINFATFKTLLFVQIIPWFAIMFGWLTLRSMLAAATFSNSGGSPSWVRWWPYLDTLFVASMYLGKDAAFIVWTRQRLYTSFRERASRNWAQSYSAAATVPPVRAVTPPPIPAPL
jgi:hypothetical protein